MRDVYEIRRENLRRVIDRHFDGSQAAMARRFNWSDSYMSRLLSVSPASGKNMGTSIARGIEQRLGLAENWMDNEHARPGFTAGEAGSTYSRSDVPLISHRTARIWMDLDKTSRAAAAEAWAFRPTACSPDTFMVRIVGPSMQASNGESYPEGHFVYIDPQRTVASGDVAYVDLPGADVPVLRQVIIEGGRYILVALNPEWPARSQHMPEGARIIGRAVFCGRIV